MKYNVKRPLTAAERNRLAAHSDTVAHLLFHRGITDDEIARRFISPDYERDVHDPFLLKDAEKAADRIIQAIQNNEKIAIYSDYDADGIPGAVIWNDFFKRIGFKNFVIYIPHRHDEGFGLNIDAVDHLALHDAVKLLITVDCGISDVKPVMHADKLGMEVIITDHHEPPVSPGTDKESLPPAFAIIDHKQADCNYPDKNLCGSGVVYKLIQAILKKSEILNSKSETNPKSEIRNTGLEGLLNFKKGHDKWLLDMVGIATLSDMVPLTGENRIFAYYGLQVLRKSPRKGLIRLLEKLKIAQRHLTEDDIAFMITPRINAASRMGVPMDAFSLLAADNDIDADKFADHLDAINNERKGVVAALVKEVKRTIKERYGSQTLAAAAEESSVPTFGSQNEGTLLSSRGRGDVLPAVIVLGNPAWRPSLLGLVANTCAEEFHRPVFLWGRDGDNAIKGSCRSDGASNVVEIMRAVPTGVFTQFGGHRHSGGFAVSNDAIHYLERRLNEAAEKMTISKHRFPDKTHIPDPKSAVQDLNGPSRTPDDVDADTIDRELSLDDIDWNLSNEINKLAPFGFGNLKPIFLFRGLVPVAVRRFGKGNEHIELSLKKENGDKIPAVSFFGAANDWAKSVKANKKVDMVASIEKSMFRGWPELRLRVIDVVTS